MTMKNTNGIRLSTVRDASMIHHIARPSTIAAQRRCRSCGAEVPLGPRFCTTCGQPLSMRLPAALIGGQGGIPGPLPNEWTAAGAGSGRPDRRPRSRAGTSEA